MKEPPDILSDQAIGRAVFSDFCFESDTLLRHEICVLMRLRQYSLSSLAGLRFCPWVYGRSKVFLNELFCMVSECCNVRVRSWRRFYAHMFRLVRIFIRRVLLFLL